MNEEWRTVPAWPAYEVSDLGRVRRVVRATGRGGGGRVRRRAQHDRVGGFGPKLGLGFMNGPLVLALDLATTTGWACGRAGGSPDFGEITFPSGRAGHGAIGASLFDWLLDLHDLQHFEQIVMEAPLPPSSQTHANTARIQFGLAFAVETWCYRRSLPVREARPDDWRRAVLGRARFGGTDKAKAASMAWCRERGWHPPQHNAADALALLHYALSRPGAKAA